MSCKIKVAMVTSWNCRCGIAEYAKYLIEAVSPTIDFSIYANIGAQLIEPEDTNVVQRCWQNCLQGNLDQLFDLICHSDADIVHFQFHFAFFELRDLAKFIDKVATTKKIILTFHLTKDQCLCNEMLSLGTIAESLKKAAAIIVHQNDDVKRLECWGLRENVILQPLGNVEFPLADKFAVRRELGLKNAPIVATFGFLLPHKGIFETLSAIAKLKDQYPAILYLPVCALHADPVSTDFFYKCMVESDNLGTASNVAFITGFLKPWLSIKLLQAADIIVLAYQPTGESASAAVKFCMAAGRPIIATKREVFADVADCLYQIDHCTPELLAGGIDYLLKNPQEHEHLVTTMLQKVENNSWSKVGNSYYNLVHNLMFDKYRSPSFS